MPRTKFGPDLLYMCQKYDVQLQEYELPSSCAGVNVCSYAPTLCMSLWHDALLNTETSLLLCYCNPLGM
jgi:hypothetical protein